MQAFGKEHLSPSECLLSLQSRHELPRVMTEVDAFCQALPASSTNVHALRLAIEEAITNVFVHGYGGEACSEPVLLRLIFESPNRIRATVTDGAPAYNPLSRPEVDTSTPLEHRRIGGLGVHLVKKLMNATQYERRDGRNVLTLELNVDPGSDGGS